jgi:class 3 adenylate cyclase
VTVFAQLAVRPRVRILSIRPTVSVVAKLDAADRAQLPDSAFAYVDSRGRRRLPIHDAAHVRNALARFSQVRFDDERARDRARSRLLKAAKRFGIVPFGFITGQLEAERELARRGASVPLPSGFVTMLLTDIEGSTALLHHLGDGYGDLLDDVRSILRDTAERMTGRVVETRADEFFAAFESPGSALDTAVSVQRQLRQRQWPDGVEVRVRVGIHSGYPKLVDANYLGMAVHTAARVCAFAHGGQIVVTGDTREAAKGLTADGVRFRRLGEYRLRGLPAAISLHQVTAKGLITRFPRSRSAVELDLP